MTAVEPPLPTRAMWLVGGTVLVISVAAFFRVPLLPSMGAELGMSAAELGLVTTVFAVGRLVTDIPAGRRADRSHPLRSLGLAGAILGLGSLAMSTAVDGAIVIASAALLGVASALANTTGMTYFTSVAPRHRRGMAVATFSAALLGGQALGPAFGGAIAGAYDWRVAVGVAAAVGAALAVFGAIVGRRALPGPTTADRATGADGAAVGADVTEPSATEDRAPTTTEHAPAGVQVTRASPGGRRQTWLLNLVPFVSMYTLGSMPQTLVPIIGDARYGLSASVIGIALGVGGACRFVGALVGGRIADRVSRKASLVPGMALGAVGVGVLALPWGVPGWVLAIVLLSLGSNAVSVAATMLGDRAPSAGVGRHLGSYRFVGDLGLIVGPTVTTVLYTRVSEVAAILSVASLMALVALSSALALHETRWLDHAD